MDIRNNHKEICSKKIVTNVDGYLGGRTTLGTAKSGLHPKSLVKYILKTDVERAILIKFSEKIRTIKMNIDKPIGIHSQQKI